MKDELSIVPKSMVPKPTKKDFINAGVERARQLFNAEKEKAEAKIKELREKMHQRIASQLGVQAGAVSYVSIRGRAEELDIDLRFKMSDMPEVTELVKAIAEVRMPMVFDSADVRRQITEAMRGDTQSAVERILSNPDAVAALDAVILG